MPAPKVYIAPADYDIDVVGSPSIFPWRRWSWSLHRSVRTHTKMWKGIAPGVGKWTKVASGRASSPERARAQAEKTRDRIEEAFAFSKSNAQVPTVRKRGGTISYEQRDRRNL